MVEQYLEVIIRNDKYVMKVQDPTNSEPNMYAMSMDKSKLFTELIHDGGYRIHSMTNDLRNKEDVRYLFVRDKGLVTDNPLV